jgi:hypothetical protein
MRLLMKITLPTPAENPEVEDGDFNRNLQKLFTEVGGLGSHSTLEDGRRVEWVIVDIDPALITPTAKFIFEHLKVKPEFVPEMTPKPYFRRVGY